MLFGEWAFAGAPLPVSKKGGIMAKFNPLKIVAELFKGVPQEMIAREVSENLRAWLTGRVSVESKKEDVRGQLLADLVTIQPPLENLRRRHREALATHRENRWVSLLIKVPHDVRSVVLPALDAMWDEEFEQALELLEHDALMQFCQRIISKTSPAFRRAWEAIQPRLQQYIVPETGERFHRYTETVEQEHNWNLHRAQEARRGCFRILIWGLSVPIILVFIFWLIALFLQ